MRHVLGHKSRRSGAWFELIQENLLRPGRKLEPLTARFERRCRKRRLRGILRIGHYTLPSQSLIDSVLHNRITTRWKENSFQTVSTMLKHGIPLVDEGLHPFFLVGGGKHRMKHPTLETDTLGQCRFIGTIDAFFGHHCDR